MSSFARTYGIERARKEQIFHELSLQWCDDNNYSCNIQLDNLKKVDNYFKKYYEENC